MSRPRYTCFSVLAFITPKDMTALNRKCNLIAFHPVLFQDARLAAKNFDIILRKHFPKRWMPRRTGLRVPLRNSQSAAVTLRHDPPDNRSSAETATRWQARPASASPPRTDYSTFPPSSSALASDAWSGVRFFPSASTLLRRHDFFLQDTQQATKSHTTKQTLGSSGHICSPVKGQHTAGVPRPSLSPTGARPGLLATCFLTPVTPASNMPGHPPTTVSAPVGLPRDLFPAFLGSRRGSITPTTIHQLPPRASASRGHTYDTDRHPRCQAPGFASPRPSMTGCMSPSRVIGGINNASPIRRRRLRLPFPLAGTSAPSQTISLGQTV